MFHLLDIMIMCMQHSYALSSINPPYSVGPGVKENVLLCKTLVIYIVNAGHGGYMRTAK